MDSLTFQVVARRVPSALTGNYPQQRHTSKCEDGTEDDEGDPTAGSERQTVIVGVGGQSDGRSYQ